MMFHRKKLVSLGHSESLGVKARAAGIFLVFAAQRPDWHVMGKGHLAAKLEGEHEIVFAQVPSLAPDVLSELVTLVESSEKVRNPSL